MSRSAGRSASRSASHSASLTVLRPDWPVHPRIRSLVTTRRGGTSRPPFDSLNLGTHVGDSTDRVAVNRSRLAAQLEGADPVWLNQVHGTDVLRVTGKLHEPPVADASWTDQPGVACTVLSADCLPVIVSDRHGTMVGAAHCGWRGLCHGVLERLLDALPVEPAELIAWLGPGISAGHYEVGAEVLDAFCSHLGSAARRVGFARNTRGRYQCDLVALARWRLRSRGVPDVYGGDFCSFADTRFYSVRRDGRCGRMATLVWLEPQT